MQTLEMTGERAMCGSARQPRCLSKLIGFRDRKLCVPASRQVCPCPIAETYHGYFELEGDPAFSIRWLKVRLLEVRLHFLRKVQSGELYLLSTTASRSRSPDNCKVSAHTDWTSGGRKARTSVHL
jgi:hypothetical protein